MDFDDKPRKGTQFGFFATKAGQEMSGGQWSFFINLAQKDYSGYQVAGLINYANYIHGAQVAYVFNLAGGFDGAQVGTWNVSTGVSNGAQVGTINVATDSLNGVQVGTFNVGAQITYPQVGVVNIARESNVQVSVFNITKTERSVQVGVTNIADSVGYVQASVLNIADKAGVIQAGVMDIADSAELQIGVINIAHHAGDRQVGILNICGYCENTSVGLISIQGNGVLSVSEFMSETGHLATNLRLGSAYFFTSFEYSRAFKEDKPFQKWDGVQVSGIGFGTQFGVYGTHFDLEYMFADVYDRKKHTFEMGSINFDPDSDANFYHRVRLGATFRVCTGFGLIGGVSGNMVTEGYGNDFAIAPKGDWFAHWNFNGHEVRVWPGFYAGLVVGKF